MSVAALAVGPANIAILACSLQASFPGLDLKIFLFNYAYLLIILQPLLKGAGI